MADKIHIPLSGNSREQLRARIGIFALACGVKNLPQEIEVDAFAEMARTTGLAESWRSAVGFPLPADRTEWFALLARGRIPAALFVEEKIRPREVLAYVAELENKASATTPNRLNPSAVLRRLEELRESMLRLHTLNAPEPEKYDHLHKLQEQVIRLACAGCLLPPEVTPPREGATGYELRLCWQRLAEFLAGPLAPHPKDLAAAVPLIGMDSVQYHSVQGDIVRWIDHGAALVRLLQDGVAVGEVGNELHLHAASVPEQIASGDRAGARHSGDFTFVNWFGREYTFALGVQTSAVRALWNEWEKSGMGLHQDTIRNAVDPERDTFRMDKAFRDHPALGTMIVNVGDGRYRLAVPDKGGASVPDGPKKSPRIPVKARRKPH